MSFIDLAIFIVIKHQVVHIHIMNSVFRKCRKRMYGTQNSQSRVTLKFVFNISYHIFAKTTTSSLTVHCISHYTISLVKKRCNSDLIIKCNVIAFPRIQVHFF